MTEAAPPHSPTGPAGEVAGDGTPLRLTTEDLNALDGARYWARINYLVIFVICVMATLFVLLIVVVGSRMPPPARMVIAVVAGAVVALMVLYASFLRRYSTGVAAHLARDSGGLIHAFRALKSWWMFLVISGALSVVVTLVMILNLLRAGAGP